MNSALAKTQIAKDLKEKSILVSREFDASLEDVWRAFTDSKLLDQWWAPLPWRTETKSMDFSVGGYWLYAMVGPENEKHWGRMNYLAISHHKSYDMEDYFCDSSGNIKDALPASKGRNVFTKTVKGTKVDFKLMYATQEDLQRIVEMGFQEGITMAFDQLQLMLKK